MANIEYKPVWSEDGQTLSNVLVKDKLETYNVTDVWYDGTPLDDSKLDSDLVYVKYEGKYLVRNFEYGQVLQKDTMQEMRDLSSYEILLLKMGVYKHVQLNGYYEEGDTPSPINYILSDTEYEDDGGSVIEVGDVKFNHDFKGVVDVRYFGARDNEEIQDIINTILIKYKNVSVPTSQYIVDVDKQQDSLGRRGIVMNDGVELNLNRAELIAKPSSSGRYSMIDIVYAENVTIKGGVLIGDRYTHDGTDGEWGHGINLWSSSNVSIEGVEIREFWGDGIYIGGVDGTGLYGASIIESESEAVPSEGVSIINTKVSDCRRQGISIVCGKEVLVEDSLVESTNGIAPQSLIDIEPNRRINERYGYVENINIVNSVFRDGATQGVTFYHLDENNYAIRDINIKGSKFLGNGSTHLNVRRAENVLVEGCYFNNSADSGNGGQVALSGKNIKFNGNHLDKTNDALYGIRVWSEQNDVTVEIKNNTINMNNGSILRVEGGEFQELLLDGNRMYGNVTNYVSIRSQDSFKNITFKGNEFKANCQLFFQLVTSSVFEGVVMYGNNFLASSCSIDIRSNFKNLSIRDNLFANTETTNITLNGAVSPIIERNNFINCTGNRVINTAGSSDVIIRNNYFSKCNTVNEVVLISSGLDFAIISDNVFISEGMVIPLRVSGVSNRKVVNNSFYGGSSPVINPNSIQMSNNEGDIDLSIAEVDKRGIVKKAVAVPDGSSIDDLLQALRDAGIIEE